MGMDAAYLLSLRFYLMIPVKRIIIADDHPFFIDGVRNSLSGHPAFQVIAAVTSGDKVIPAIKEQQPELVLLDINLPQRDGISVAKEIRTLWPDIRIMLLTMYMPEDIDLNLQDRFFDAYVLKNSGTDVLFYALEEMSRGNKFIDPNLQKNSNHKDDNFAKQLKLSTREKEILRLLIGGYNNKQIGERLFLSELTIKTHRKNIMKKMGAHNLADLLKKGK